MIEQLNLILSQNNAGWDLPASGAWHFWVYNNWHSHDTNLDIMWFHGKDKFPRLVTKLNRLPKTLKREFENLTRVHSGAPAYVPKPLTFGRLDRFWALWMEGVPGVPFNAGHSLKKLDAIVDALVSIHKGVRGQGNRTPLERYRHAVVEPFENAAQFGDSAVVRAGCANLSWAIKQEWLDDLPVIPQHGDCYSGNIVWFEGEPRVVDWETFGVIDLPFYDLLTFLVALLMPDGMVPATCDPALVRHVPSLIHRYSKGLSIPIPDLKFLVPLVLVNWFHLMWLDGRRKFPPRMYRLLEHWFEQSDFWGRISLA